MRKERIQRKFRANQALNIVTILIEMVMSHETAAQEKGYGQELDALERIGLHLVYAKVTTVTLLALGTIAQKLQ